ncbi:outer membrane lipoprotein carrier protein LolA [Leifsonia sp. EB34]|uniref:LolA family protein n=1 Tax=Leifsonia sp. EB34 TaxID=3156303 RepID=UPI0035199C71
MKHRLIRWLPAIVVPAAIAAGAIAIPLAAGAADLPVKSPADVLRLVASSDTKAFSGTVEQTTDLGLPSIPKMGGGSSSADSSIASTLSLLMGDHSAKVYVDGPTKVRVQLLDQLAERDAIRNGSDVWLYQSSDQSVTHATIPAHEKSGETPAPTATPDATATTPQALAEKFLAAVDPSTQVTLGPNTKVANRDAYDLVLTPRTDATLVGSVSIAVDGQTGLPLQVQVTARGASSPSFQAWFKDFTPSAPDASVFSFTPPKGAKVTEQAPKTGEHSTATNRPKPTVTGTGWATIVSLPAGTVPAQALADPLVAQLTQSVGGGRALSTSLMSVLVTADGRLLAGAVPVSALQAAAQ